MCKEGGRTVAGKPWRTWLKEDRAKEVWEVKRLELRNGERSRIGVD